MGRLTGTIGLGEQVAELSAYRAGFHALTRPCPLTGRYTMAFAGNDNAAAYPGGHGAATVLVDAGGNLTFAGTLGDGTPVTQSARLSRDGNWPLHLTLYKGRGLVLGWLEFANRPESDLSGLVNWSKPPLATSTGGTYPAGFRFTTAAAGSRYTAPDLGEALLRMTNGVVAFTGGTLTEAFDNPVLLGADSRILNLGTTPLSVTFTPKTGSFKGKSLQSGPRAVC